jgi:hypothetical protein
MFNPEKLLGGLLRSSMTKSNRGGFLNEGMAMGLLGVALFPFSRPDASGCSSAGWQSGRRFVAGGYRRAGQAIGWR